MERQVETQPTEMMERVVRALVPPENREYVLGDLRERYVSPKRYLLDALTTIPSLIGTRLRRTQHPIGIALGAGFYWFGVFYGNIQSSWVVAAIPTIVALIAGALRDVYRAPDARQPHAAFLDALVFAGSAVLSQAVVSLVAPDYLLLWPALVLGLPIGSVLVFLLRWQMSGMSNAMRLTTARRLSRQELMQEVRDFESISRRNLRMEMAAGLVVAAGFSFFAVMAPNALSRIGLALLAASGLFVASFLYLRARVQRMPDDLSFEESVRYQRERLGKAKRMMRAAVWWYVLPLALGPIVLIVQSVLDEPNPYPKLFFRLTVLALAALLLQQMQRLSAKTIQTREEQLAMVREKGLEP